FRRNGEAIPGAQVVDDDDLMAGRDRQLRNDRADVTGTAGNEEFHGCQEGMWRAGVIASRRGRAPDLRSVMPRPGRLAFKPVTPRPIRPRPAVRRGRPELESSTRSFPAR